MYAGYIESKDVFSIEIEGALPCSVGETTTDKLRNPNARFPGLVACGRRFALIRAIHPTNIRSVLRPLGLQVESLVRAGLARVVRNVIHMFHVINSYDEHEQQLESPDLCSRRKKKRHSHRRRGVFPSVRFLRSYTLRISSRKSQLHCFKESVHS